MAKGLGHGMEVTFTECLTQARYFAYLFKLCNHFAVEGTRAQGAYREQEAGPGFRSRFVCPGLILTL